ncbi:MAG: hypothetical protein D6798_04495 [Deltaproteobacteria bacterium]|nr:MAG: hypothetical protein D6798_04495 [Deltaproteobacteria bacterium]
MILLLATVALAQGQAPPPIVNGSETGDWPSIGLLAAVDLSANKGAPFCSATLVGYQAIVTAAHCADAARVYAEDYDVAFIIGDSISTAEQLVLVDDWVIHPDYVFNEEAVAADVAVGFLASRPAAVAPMPVLGEVLGQTWYDRDLTLVGYGITGDDRLDAGVKRTADLPVWYLDGDFVYGLDEADPSTPNACSGDSGGAALIEGEGGSMILGGVISFVFPWQDPTTACIGGGVGATRMDVFGGWVAEQVTAGFTTGTAGSSVNTGTESMPIEDDTGCATPVGGPVPFGAVLLGLLGLSVRRR